ncbi:MAG: hypothetical protein K0U72_03355 [Gammaproteobacteria bacterium]|nr:hypothetical protein [Gammaproteobacteria bacterium]
MNAKAAGGADSKMHKIQQTIKWIVYTLLIINFVYYIFEDWNRATHTLTSSSTFLDWTSEFATSIDESAWFILLFMLELETYIIDDENWQGWSARIVRGVRVICIVMIAHTIYAFSASTIKMHPTVPVENVSSLCSMIDKDVSYVYNLEYTEVTAATCDSLSTASEFYWVSTDPVVSDLAGLTLERHLLWADLAEAVIWVLVLLAIEIVVRQQDRGITGGALFVSMSRSKFVMYALLLLLGVYWASLGHWIYLWDEIVWIGGFAAIEMNISEWRDDLLEQPKTA